LNSSTNYMIYINLSGYKRSENILDESKELGTKNIGELLLKFSVPAVIGMLVNALYSVVDRIFIGRGVGSLPLSGVAITFPITNIIMGVGMLIGAGSAAVVSIKLGEKKDKEAEKIIGNAFVLTMILPIIVSVLGLLFLRPMLVLFGASEETMPYAMKFASILLAGGILQNIGFGLNPIIRSVGDPRTAMNTMLIGALLNFILNPLFIFVFKMGVAGSALATLISQAVCSIWIVKYFISNSIIKLKRVNMKLEKRIVLEIISIGISPFIMQIAASAVTVIINTSLVKYGGDLAVGAYSLIISIAILTIMPMLGVNQGAQPIIGYNYGAKNIHRVKKTFLYAFIVNTCIAIFGWTIIELFPVQIISIFNKTDHELISLASKGLAIFLMSYWAVGAQVSCVNYFQSIGKARHSMILSFLRQVVILIPLVLILPHFFQLQGVWMAGPIADFSALVITVIFLMIEMRSLKMIEKADNYHC